LGTLRQQFEGVPIIGLTATATDVVQNDVKHMLNIPKAIAFKCVFFKNFIFFQLWF
jgi:superfamily II DNA helicase RecQ